LYEAARDFRYKEGFVVPLHFQDSICRPCSALILYIWTDPVQKFTFMISEHRHELHLKTIYWAQRAINLVEAERQPKFEQPRSNETPSRMLLTDRERDVLTWAARGKTVLETATILGISENTIETHFKSVYEKMNVTNKTHAVVTAIYTSLIDV
jgi:LuxR family transcriptional regulator, quorum-sensing system regulator BjaR1